MLHFVVFPCFKNLLDGTCCEGVETNHCALISGFYEILSFDVVVQIFIYLLFSCLSLMCQMCAVGTWQHENPTCRRCARSLGPSSGAKDGVAGRRKGTRRSVAPPSLVAEEIT
jgi:hypothetical protein